MTIVVTLAKRASGGQRRWCMHTLSEGVPARAPVLSCGPQNHAVEVCLLPQVIGSSKTSSSAV